MPKIISVVSYKGGVGKSTTCFHLADRLQRVGKALINTLLIDGDLNRSVLDWIGDKHPGFNAVDELKAAHLMQEHEYVVIDTPARPALEDLKFLASNSDLLIVPTAPSAPALRPTLEMLGHLNEIGAGNHRVLLTICPPGRSGSEAQQALREQGFPVFNTLIPKRSIYEHAALAGVSVFDFTRTIARENQLPYNPSAKESAEQAYKDLIQEVLQLIGTKER